MRAQRWSKSPMAAEPSQASHWTTALPSWAASQGSIDATTEKPLGKRLLDRSRHRLKPRRILRVLSFNNSPNSLPVSAGILVLIVSCCWTGFVLSLLGERVTDPDGR